MLTADYRQFINRNLPPRERGCTSKVAYSTRREARALARNGRHSDGRLSAYHCRFCAFWHLGHQRRR
jgi:hypothetical protein